MYKKTRLILAASTAVAIALAVLISGLFSWGVLKSGNSSDYSVSKVEQDSTSTLTDQTIVFVGSNILAGTKASGTSFVDYLEQSDGINAAVFAKDDITLVQSGSTSIVSLINTIPTKDANPRMLLCEVPYADALHRSRIGKLTDGYFNNDYNTRTIIGAMEYIISYSQDKWGCPVVFYTCQPNDNAYYARIMDAVMLTADKWNVEVINFYNDPQLPMDDEHRALYMANESGPTKAGYKEFFVPVFRQFLLSKIY